MTRLDAAYAAILLATLPLWARKARGGIAQRFGHLERMLSGRPDGRPRLLLHAVSVGEVSALRSLVPRLADEADVIVSTTTDTGLARARSLYGGVCEVVRYPLDFSGAVRRFLDAVRPDAVSLVELEVWPQFVRACRARSIPVCVINGRLSERSFRGYRRLGGFFRPLFATLDFAAVQDEAYARRFEAMGVPPERCLLTGSMKWDNAGSAHANRERGEQIARNMGVDLSRPLIVAGSTGPGEEALLARATAGLGAQLLCAPRKPQRFEEAAAALTGCARRSVTREGGPPAAPHDRFLLDTIGELSDMYAVADVVVIGRSFFDLHGSDPTEPIGLGKPVVIGPAVTDFASIVAAFEAAGGIVRADTVTLRAHLQTLLENPGLRAALGRRGAACIAEHAGASERHAELLLSLLDRRSAVATGEATRT